MFGGSHIRYSIANFLKLLIAIHIKNMTLSYVQKRKAVSDTENNLIHKKLELLKVHGAQDTEKPYKLLKGKLIELPLVNSWTT